MECDTTTKEFLAALPVVIFVEYVRLIWRTEVDERYLEANVRYFEGCRLKRQVSNVCTTYFLLVTIWQFIRIADDAHVQVTLTRCWVTKWIADSAQDGLVHKLDVSFTNWVREWIQLRLTATTLEE